eukprot:scaffold2416_cov116-Skeletonema_menzelii.AAC.3
MFKNKYHSAHNRYTCLRAPQPRCCSGHFVCRRDFAAIYVHLYASLLDIEVTKKNEKTALHKRLLQEDKRIKVLLQKTFLEEAGTRRSRQKR